METVLYEVDIKKPRDLQVLDVVRAWTCRESICHVNLGANSRVKT